MSTKFVVEIKEDILKDVLEYAEAQGVEPYVWIERLIRRNVSSGKEYRCSEPDES